ncbi:MAG: NAD(P)H-hydrate epimerase, partial [Flavobacteriales bacterium]
MIPVLGPEAIRQADAYTIAHEPIASIELMERAASRCATRIVELVRLGRFTCEPFLLVVAGMGNNGGDGLVVARLLHRSGLPVRVVRVRHRPSASPDNEANRLRAVEAGVEVLDLDAVAQWPGTRPGLIIDALFGTGLSAPLRGLPAEAVRAMNGSGAPIIAIDLPSGLFAEDNAGNDPQAIVRASLTLTLELPKLCLLLPENAPFTGEWEAVPIGLHQGFIQGCDVPLRVVERGDAAALMPARPRFAHKGSFGHALLIGGSEGRIGAMVIAAKAALRSGAGLVTVAVPRCGRDVVQTAAPEAMCLPDPDATGITALPALAGFSAIGIGPGLGAGKKQTDALGALLASAQAPLVLDADAITILAAAPALRQRLPPLLHQPGKFGLRVAQAFGFGFQARAFRL